MRRLAARYTVIAPDTPGNGLSEAIGVHLPAMSDFAHGLAAFLDTLGIAHCAVYGFHTGGACALEFARLYPQRVACAVVNGYIELDKNLREDILKNYFASLAIDWSGSHLAWLWSRMREQWSFFPWYRRELAFRPQINPPSPEAIHEGVLEMLEAGNAYRDSYSAAFAYDSSSTVQELKVPTLVMTARDDVLFPSLAHLHRLAACVRVKPADDLDHAERMLESELARIPQSLPEPPPARTIPRPSLPWSSYVRAGELQIHVRQLGAASGRPFVVQHSAVESTRCVERLVKALACHGPAAAFDLPGRGASDSLSPDEAVSITVDADYLSAAFKELGLHDSAFVGWRAGATVGLELASRGDHGIHHLVALQPPWLPRILSPIEIARLVPSLRPDAAGSQLLRAWHMLRAQELYEPWYEQNLRHMVRHHEPDLEPTVIQRRLEALFRCDGAADHWSAALSFAALERLAEVTLPILIGDPSPTLAKCARAAGNPACRIATLPQNDFPALTAALQQFGEI